MLSCRAMQADKWDSRFLSLAEVVASWSKDPSTKVGAVIVRPDRTIASAGFNGFPRGVLDDDERYADRPTKYAMAVHGEANAIVNAREPLHGYSIYCTLFPCSVCAALIIQAGIINVSSLLPDADQIERWRDSWTTSETMLNEAEVSWQRYDSLAGYTGTPPGDSVERLGGVSRWLEAAD